MDRFTPTTYRTVVVLSITMYNEAKFIKMQMENALELDCYDHICILDDGSTDGTWDLINEYASKYKHVHVYRNEKNSVLSLGENRWYTASKIVAKFEPTWVNNRAADIILSDPAKKHLRSQFERYTKEPVSIISIPNVHLWRSKTWWRADDIWGKQAFSHSLPSIWRFSNYNFWHDDQKKAGMHQGFTRPSNLGFGRQKLRHANINNGISSEFPWAIVGLHHGHIDQEAKAKKFIWSMESAKAAFKAGKSLGMPPPGLMPPVEHWIMHNGYKGFVEWDMDLRKVHQEWYDKPVEYDPYPTPESIYEEIKKYNPMRAEEYKRIFNDKVRVPVEEPEPVIEVVEPEPEPEPIVEKPAPKPVPKSEPKKAPIVKQVETEKVAEDITTQEEAYEGECR